MSQRITSPRLIGRESQLALLRGLCANAARATSRSPWSRATPASASPGSSRSSSRSSNRQDALRAARQLLSRSPARTRRTGRWSPRCGACRPDAAGGAASALPAPWSPSSRCSSQRCRQAPARCATAHAAPRAASTSTCWSCWPGSPAGAGRADRRGHPLGRPVDARLPVLHRPQRPPRAAAGRRHPPAARRCRTCGRWSSTSTSSSAAPPSSRSRSTPLTERTGAGADRGDPRARPADVSTSRRISARTAGQPVLRRGADRARRHAPRRRCRPARRPRCSSASAPSAPSPARGAGARGVRPRRAPRPAGGRGGIEEPDALATLRPAVDAHVVVGDDATVLTFRHAPHPRGGLRRAAPGERRRLHAAVAAALYDRPDVTDAAELAVQWRAADEPDGRARRLDRRPRGPPPSVYAYSEAVEHYTAVGRLWDPTGAPGLDSTAAAPARRRRRRLPRGRRRAADPVVPARAGGARRRPGPAAGGEVLRAPRPLPGPPPGPLAVLLPRGARLPGRARRARSAPGCSATRA